MTFAALYIKHLLIVREYVMNTFWSDFHALQFGSIGILMLRFARWRPEVQQL